MGDGSGAFGGEKDGHVGGSSVPSAERSRRQGEGMPDLSKLLRHSDCPSHCPPASSDLPASSSAAAGGAAAGDAGDAGGGKGGVVVEGDGGGDKEAGDEGGKNDFMDHDGPAAAATDGAGAASAHASAAADTSGPLPVAAAAAAAGAYQQQPAVEISVPPESITTANRQVRSRQLWGTDVYTDDSDIVAVLMHVGYITPVSVPPPASIAELRATIRVLPPQPSYRSSSRNSMRSRAWGSGKGTCSYAVESCRIIKQDGTSIDLEASSARTPPVGPTLVPAAVERTMTTRASASVRNAHRHQRFVQEVTLQYNLCNEPWLKYSMAIIADHGLKRPQFTSARLKRAEVLYLETATHRFELSYEPVSARKVFYSVALSQAQQQQQMQAHTMPLDAANAKADGAAAAAGDGGAAADAGAGGVVREGGVDAGGDKEGQGGRAGERNEREKGAAEEGEGAEGSDKGAKEKQREGGSESKAADGEGKEHPEAPAHPPSKAHTSSAAAANAANANSPNTNSTSAAPSSAAAGTAAGGSLSGSKRPFSLFSSPSGILGTNNTNPETQWILPQSALAHLHGKGKGPRDTYRWTQCVPPLPLDQLRSHGCPLPAAFTKILESGLAWGKVQWASGGVCGRIGGC
ncbi:unnamed protein product [Closterium sp. NIES-65]|nr:unnamed protein product [Closterium sp. NIES-65]